MNLPVNPLEPILRNNRAWVSRKKLEDPEFFHHLAEGQEPNYLFVGCADSRVPANEITGTGPGEMFVHRNIANQVFSNDMNLLSVLQYGVDALQIQHIIVCGHYGCGGVKAGCSHESHGLVDNWLGQIQHLHEVFRIPLLSLEDDEARHKRMVELSVLAQVRNLGRTPIVREAWARGQRLMLHGLVYDINEGLLMPLVAGVAAESDLTLFRDLWAIAASPNRGRIVPVDD